MKIFYLPLFANFCIIALAFISCTLDKEPEISTGVNNVENPLFLNAEITTDTNDNFHVKAWLNNLGNLNIQYHGWVWSRTQGATLLDNNLLLGPLNLDSFSDTLSGLDLGEIYYLRPVVITGHDTIYGQELCSFLGVNFTINTDIEIFQGADVKFTNTTPCNNCTYLWDFGDGNTTTTASPKHTFNTKGNFTVRLTATNSGCTVTRDMILNVVDDPFQDYWADIPGGAFMMGCTSEQEPCDTLEPHETPVHPVTIKNFFMGKTEVTRGQWKAVMGDIPMQVNPCEESCPIELVSWNDVVNEFIPALNRKTGRVHRLPSEAEWEYAARADTNTIYAGSDSIDLVAWYFIVGGANSPHPVAQKLPNKFGLFDMSGNMWEYVEDDFHEDYVGAPDDGTAWIDDQRPPTRMARGGGWGSGKPRSRIAFRNHFEVEDSDDSWGFRLARSK